MTVLILYMFKLALRAESTEGMTKLGAFQDQTNNFRFSL